MIQGAIDGASNNSLRIKGIAMILFAGTIAFLLRDSAATPVIPLTLSLVLLLTVFILGLLDFYFVRQSDLLRILYNRVQGCSEGNIDFSMEVEQYSEELSNLYGTKLPIPIVGTIAFYICASLSIINAALP